MKIKINNFEGPLDLLLQLIESNELDITEVSLLQVTEQYLDYLEQIEEKKPDDLADFLLIAAKLLYIKSKVLLPGLEMEGEEDSIELAEQLRMYKRYLEASKVIESKFQEKTFAFSRPDVLEVKVKFEPPKSLTVSKLKNIFEAIIKELEVVARLPKKSLEKVISIKEKIKQIQKLLAEKNLINFSEIIASLKNKTEIIVSFLGILELSKQREISLEQKEAFGEIKIKANKRE